MKKPRNSPRRDVLPVERNAAIARAIGKHKTTEQGRRILAMATASLERGQSPELKERIEAARARRDIEAKAQSAGLKKEEREAAWLSEGKLKAQAAKLKKSFEEDRTRRVEALEQSSDLGDRAQAARLKKNIQAGSPGAELWGEVAAARARRNVEKVKGQTQAEGRKRKADMLDEDEDGEAEDSGQAERKEEAEETSLGEENNKDEDWDEMETEAAIQNSLHDDNAPRE